MNSVKRLLLLLLLSTIVLWLQGNLFRSLLPFESFTPNLTVVLIAFLGFYDVTVLGACFAFLLGLQLDLFSGIRIGPWAGAYVALYGMIACFGQRMFIESRVAVIFSVFVASLGANALYLSVLAELKASVWSVLGEVLLDAACAALCAPLIFFVLKRLFTRTGSSAIQGKRVLQGRGW